AEVKVQMPLPLFVPADSVAPLGNPEIVIGDSVCAPSWVVNATAMLSAMAVPALPEAFDTISVGGVEAGARPNAWACSSVPSQPAAKVELGFNAIRSSIMLLLAR